MSGYNNLTLEQELNLKKISERAKTLSYEQAQRLIIELQPQIMIKDNLYRELIKQK